MKLQLTIYLGNAEMQTPADIAAALRETAGKLHDPGDDTSHYAEPFEPLRAAISGTIRDLNGNVVGNWGVTS